MYCILFRGLFFLLLCMNVNADIVPPVTIPDGLYEAFTMNGAIPVIYNYMNESKSQAYIYSYELVEQYIASAKARQTKYYGVTDIYLYQALDTYRDQVRKKDVAVIGSVTPWYESVLISYKAYPTTIEYNKIISKHPKIKTLTVKEYEASPRLFDAVVSISSIEHDGLGRYGDPINPNGDFQAMDKTKAMLKKGGLLFLSIPVGKDCLVWNLHRVYGKLRLYALLSGWEFMGSFGFSSADLDIDAPHAGHQPVFVLRVIK